MSRSIVCIIALAGLLVFASAPAEADYHAANPCAANPCAAQNPCAANPCNPCAAKGAARGPISVRTVWGQVVSASPSAGTLAVRANGETLNLRVDRRTEIKMATRGMEKKSLADLRPGARVAVSFLDQRGSQRAAYVYLSQAAANPCAANPCAGNPCAARNPCAANPCAANPCAAKNPCAGKTMNPCNPCGARR